MQWVKENRINRFAGPGAGRQWPAADNKLTIL